MKKALPMLVLLLVCLSCKKDSPATILNRQIAGKWEHAERRGYWMNYTLPPGNGDIIVIRKDGTFERKRNNSVVSSGTYSLEERTDCYTRSSNILFLTNESDLAFRERYVSLEDGRLLLSMPNCWADGDDDYYRRIE